MTEGLRYGELPSGYGLAVNRAHDGCARACAAAREAWLLSGDDAVYLEDVRRATSDAEHALYEACDVYRGRSMQSTMHMIADPHPLEEHRQRAHKEVIAARRQRARAAVGEAVVARIEALHAPAPQRVEPARADYFASGDNRAYGAAVDAVRYEMRRLLRVLEEELIAAGHTWQEAQLAVDYARLDGYGHRIRHDIHEYELPIRAQRKQQQ